MRVTAASSNASAAAPEGGDDVLRLLDEIVAPAPGDGDGDGDAGHSDVRLVDILSSIQETAYVWDVPSDRIDWETNAVGVLGVRAPAAIATGRDFQFLIAPEHLSRRHEAIGGQPSTEIATGVPYRLQYRFMPKGRRTEDSLWLEDHGRWWPGSDGRPAKVRGVIRVINERYWEEQKLLYRSDHDELTGQLNRIRLNEALDAVASRATTSSPSAFLVVAINNLAVVNEAFGFDVGDEVIAATGRVIKESLRGGDSIGRYSSNKFGIILNDCGPGAMRIAAERFMKSVRDRQIKTSRCQVSATISVGGVLLPDQAGNSQQAINNALQALDKAKTRRQDTFQAFEPSPTRETARRRNITIADAVTSALDQHRMLLALQPIVTTQSRQPAHYECLLRMEDADGKVVSAGDFITVAEQLGMSRLIDRRTLELTIDLLKKRPDLDLTLNVSSLTCSDHEWLVALHRLTGGQRRFTERLTIEITETAAIADIDQSISFVDTLKEFGCRVAIDDFGAGYTSFRNLKHLAVDMVKIDGAFVKNLATDMTDRIFVKTMADLAHAFDMETVAEWVGDEETAQFLGEIGITYLQGYHVGKPLLIAELPEPAAAKATAASL